jgi:tripartite-type tricarboxylate transporter receptor subunit TctC
MRDWPSSPICRRWKKPALLESAPSQALFARSGVPNEVLQTIFDATIAALHTPEASSAFRKQTFNIVPNASLADAKTWLSQQIDTWRKITAEVKIETE